MTDVFILIAAGVVTTYLFATFILGAVFSMIGGWRWDQFTTAAGQVGIAYLICLGLVALICLVFYLLYLVGRLILI